MSNKIVTVVLIIIALAVGVYIGPRISNFELESDGGSDEKEILYWVAPMDPNYKRDEPGKSPMGMDLVPVYAGDELSGDEITISPAVENNLGVRTAPATVRPLWRRIEATGYVGFDEKRISHINLRTQGWITRLLVDSEGERVKKGDLLFEYYSPELVNAQKEYLQASKRSDSRLKAGSVEKLLALGMNRSGIEALAKRGRARTCPVSGCRPRYSNHRPNGWPQDRQPKPGWTICPVKYSLARWITFTPFSIRKPELCVCACCLKTRVSGLNPTCMHGFPSMESCTRMHSAFPAKR
jgi:hypothetical protein